MLGHAGGRRILRLLLIVATAGLALVTLFTSAARFWWAFDLFSHFRLQYVVIALALCLAALAGRAHLCAGALAAIALVHGFAIKDLWLGGGAAAASEGVPLRVVSANVLNSNRAQEEVLEFVRRSDAGVVVLVDALRTRWREVLSALGEDYPYRAPDTWRDGAPVILLSRHPIVRDTVESAREGRRPYLAADLVLGDRTLMAVGVHPSSPSPRDPSDTHQRNLQLDYLAELVEGKDRPVIVAGDFNTTPWSPHFRDLLVAAGLRNAANGHGYIATWPRWFWPAQIPIDHILVRGPVATASMKRGPSIGSDHYPIIADLRIMGG